MNYINELKKFANDESKFQEVLIKVRDNIKNSSLPHKESTLLLKNLNDYCDKRLEESISDNKYIYLLNGEDFCIFILTRMLNKIKEKHTTNKEATLQLLRQKKLPSIVEGTVKELFVRDVLNVLEIGFKDKEPYWVNKVENDLLLELVWSLMKNMNSKVLYDVAGVKPIVFIYEDGGKEANITLLGIVLKKIDIVKIKSNPEYQLAELYGDIINQCVETTMCILLQDILTEYDIDRVSSKYGISRNDIKIKVGMDIASYLSNQTSKYSDILKDIISISENNRKKEAMIENHILNLSKQIM